MPREMVDYTQLKSKFFNIAVRKVFIHLKIVHISLPYSLRLYYFSLWFNVISPLEGVHDKVGEDYVVPLN